MPRQTRATAITLADEPTANEPGEPAAWKLEAAKQLKRRHSIVATAIPEHIWVNLYGRRLSPKEAADQAEIYYRSALPASKRRPAAKK
jgi:hypothetical protein